MYAAIVRSFDSPPRYDNFDDPPAPAASHEVVVDVLASGLSPRVRSGASGAHYASTAALPLIPGVDGVGRTPSGELVYFVLPDTAYGAMAERTLVDRRRSVALPADADPVRIAAGLNPAMSSWVALRQRIEFAPGASVLVLGATGTAGGMAVEIARHLGARRVVAAGRDEQRLAAVRALGADATVGLDSGAVAEVAADVDVVLDYVWGEPAAAAMVAIVTARADRGRALDWIQIGSVAGPVIQLPSVALRAANLRVMGSGQGSVPTSAVVAELPHIAAAITAGVVTVNAVAHPLRDVEAVWAAPVASGERVVFTP